MIKNTNTIVFGDSQLVRLAKKCNEHEIFYCWAVDLLYANVRQKYYVQYLQAALGTHLNAQASLRSGLASKVERLAEAHTKPYF